MSGEQPFVIPSVLKVSTALVAALDDRRLGELVNELLRAEAYRYGLDQSDITVNAEENAKDGGCDAWSGRPARASAWLGSTATCWQLKAGTAGQPSKLRGEVCKPIPVIALMEGYRVVVVASGSTNGEKGERDRLKVLVADAERTRLATENLKNLVVLGSEKLAAWCNEHPRVAARWAGRPEALWTTDQWFQSDPHQVPWQAAEQTQRELNDLRRDLDLRTGYVRHLHIFGPPGVGKTRFALELCRGANFLQEVLYVRQAIDDLARLLHSAGQDPGVQLVLVVDEVPSDRLDALRDQLDVAQGRVRLITIGHGKSPDGDRIPSKKIEPLDSNSLAKIVQGAHPQMPREHAQFVATFSNGYVRLAILAAQAVVHNAAADVHGLLGQDDISTLLDRMLPDQDRRALHVVAVLSSVGWTGDLISEGQAVAEHLGQQWPEVQARVADFDRRLGIAPLGGRLRYISPTPLGAYLAVEAWRAYPDKLATLPDVLPSERAREAYYERLSSMASSPQARNHARDELQHFFFQPDELADATAVRRWAALSAADPEEAARRAAMVLSRATLEERLAIRDQTRSSLRWTLVRLAWRSATFHDATVGLALLAEAENEIWGNNASGEFVARYQVYLGGTAVPYLDRLTTLDELIATGRPALLRLAIRALRQVAEQHVSRSNSGYASDDLPELEWLPSAGEHLACVGAALDRLAQIVRLGLPDLESDLVAAAQALSQLLGFESVRPPVVEVILAVRSVYPSARESLRRSIAGVLQLDRKYRNELQPRDLQAIEALHSQFEDSSLMGRLEQRVGSAPWDTAEDASFTDLAHELSASPTALAEAWPWLTSGDARSGWALGEALANADASATLATRMLEFADRGPDLRVLLGYIAAQRKAHGDDWYDSWVVSQVVKRDEPTSVLVDVVSMCRGSATTCRHLANALHASGQQLSAGVVGQLAFGSWHAGGPADAVQSVVEALTASGHPGTAITIVYQLLDARPNDERERWLSAARPLVLHGQLIRAGRAGMDGYYWREVAMKLVDRHACDIAAAILREHANTEQRPWFAIEHSYASEVLSACVSMDPDGVWQGLRDYLVSPRSSALFSVGFPGNILEAIPSDAVLAWVGDAPAERARTVIRLTSKSLSNDETLAARLMGEYGNRAEVSKAFFSEYISGSWWGPASAHWDELANQLKAVADRTKLTNLRQWARRSVRSLAEMARQDREREEEEGVQGRY
jgi:hypothetical protein